MEITLRKGVFIFIGLVVFLIVIFILLGGINKVGVIWDQIFGENIKDDDGTGARFECPAEFIPVLIEVGNLFENAKSNANSRCLMPMNSIPNIGDYKIQIESASGGTIISIAKNHATNDECVFKPEDGENENVIEGIWPCVVGGDNAGDYWRTFKENWFYNYADVKEGEAFPGPPVIYSEGDETWMYTDRDLGGMKMGKDLGQRYVYKTTIGGKMFMCFIGENSDEEKDMLRRIPLCDQSSGPGYGSKTRYACSIKNDGTINNENADEIYYYFNENEYYCDNDNIYYCDGRDGKFNEIDAAEIGEKKQCEGDQRPYNKQDDCCCLTKNPDGSPGRPGQCIRYSFPEDKKDQMVESCSDLGPFWEQQKCPEDISYRAGYVDRSSGGGGPW